MPTGYERKIAECALLGARPTSAFDLITDPQIPLASLNEKPRAVCLAKNPLPVRASTQGSP